MRDELVQALAGWIPAKLAAELVEDFLTIRRDVAVGIPGRAAPGKFVESVVQVLQFLTTGAYDDRPAVDRVLQTAEGHTGLDEGLRICVARIARSMYTLRNKRGLAHKADIDPNEYDLLYLHSAAQWVMAEMVRAASRCTIAEANALLRRICAPVGGVVEDFGDRKLVLADLPVREEILVLLHSEYPRSLGQRQITDSLDRSSTRSVLNALKTAWRQRLVEGTPEAGYTLTRLGLREAAGILVGMAI
jgi:hypothetical protein